MGTHNIPGDVEADVEAILVRLGDLAPRRSDVINRALRLGMARLMEGQPRSDAPEDRTQRIPLSERYYLAEHCMDEGIRESQVGEVIREHADRLWAEAGGDEARPLGEEDGEVDRERLFFWRPEDPSPCF